MCTAIPDSCSKRAADLTTTSCIPTNALQARTSPSLSKPADSSTCLATTSRASGPHGGNHAVFAHWTSAGKDCSRRCSRGPRSAIQHTTRKFCLQRSMKRSYSSFMLADTFGAACTSWPLPAALTGVVPRALAASPALAELQRGASRPSPAATGRSASMMSNRSSVACSPGTTPWLSRWETSSRNASGKFGESTNRRMTGLPTTPAVMRISLRFSRQMTCVNPGRISTSWTAQPDA
mmetsp:Transcript_16250/g.53109  ORF Transcript_16250/g.53109 Transcript_16250/m.53109 type:complete len:236 (-) Transcript_16250:767-1474(-)